MCVPLFGDIPMKRIFKIFLITVIIGLILSAAADRGLDWLIARLEISASNLDNDDQDKTNDLSETEEESGDSTDDDKPDDTDKPDDSENRKAPYDDYTAEYANLQDLPWNLYYYYNRMNEQEKKMYCQMLSGLRDHKNEFSFSLSDRESIQIVYSQLMADHSELFWVGGGYTLWIGTQVRMVVNTVLDAANIDSTARQIEDSAADCINQIKDSMSDYEKIEFVYEYLVDHTEYNLDAENNQNIQSIFLNHETVCAGYAKAMQYLLYKEGIQCLYITGMAGGPHAWNVVRIDDGYYYIDVTWGDPVIANTGEEYDNINFDYLCDTEEEFMFNRSLDETSEVPPCDSFEYNFYNVHGWLYNTYNELTIMKNVQSAVENGNNTIYMKFMDSRNYQTAYDNICVTGKLYRQIYQVFQNSNVPGNNILIFCDDNFKTIQLKWYTK